jgi:hypothetical protein
MTRTKQEVVDYIEREWPEVTDPRHCASMIERLLERTTLDKAICYYQRTLHDF